MSESTTTRTEADAHLDDEQLAGFLVGELSAAEYTRLLAHLDQCPECYELAMGAAAVFDDVSGAPAGQATADPALAPVVPITRRRVIPWWQATAAAVLVAAVAGVFLLPNRTLSGARRDAAALRLALAEALPTRGEASGPCEQSDENARLFRRASAQYGSYLTAHPDDGLARCELAQLLGLCGRDQEAAAERGKLPLGFYCPAPTLTTTGS